MNSALGTALHILRCIDEGQSRKEIIQSLDNNEQLVSVWIQYLKAISWLKEDTQGNLVASEDGKLQGYNDTRWRSSSKLKDTNIISREHDSDKYQQEIVNSFQSAYAKFMEITVMSCWSYYWWWIPTMNRLVESQMQRLS